MNTIIFSSYDCCRWSALLLSDAPFHSPTKTDYKETDCDGNRKLIEEKIKGN